MEIGLGIIVGLVLGFANFKILAITVKKAIIKPPKKASIILFLSYFLRYLCIAVIAILFIKYLKADIFALVISLVVANILPVLIVKREQKCPRV